MTKVYERIACILTAYANCEKSGNVEWMVKWDAELHRLMSDAPSGSGIDCGTSIDMDSLGKRGCLIFSLSFHHMSPDGYYCGWNDYTVKVKPDLCFGITVDVYGRDRFDIKNYLGEVYTTWLMSEWKG